MTAPNLRDLDLNLLVVFDAILRERSVVLKHALRNALVPIVTLGALELGTLLSGAVLTEQVFSIPGFGKLIVDSVFNRDYAVVQGVVLVTASAYIVLSLLAERTQHHDRWMARVNRGISWASRYSWELFAREMASLYREVAHAAADRRTLALDSPRLERRRVA